MREEGGGGREGRRDFRQPEYQRLKNEMERKTKKLEKKKETANDDSKTVKRKIEREEERLKVDWREGRC